MGRKFSLRKCSFRGCRRKHFVHGLCDTHWKQRLRGAPLMPIRQYDGRQKYRKDHNPCYELRPTKRTVLFHGKFISCWQIAYRTGVATSTVGAIFRGERRPSIRVAQKIALALGMDLSLFIHALDIHQGLKKPHSYKNSPPIPKVPEPALHESA